MPAHEDVTVLRMQAGTPDADNDVNDWETVAEVELTPINEENLMNTLLGTVISENGAPFQYDGNADDPEISPEHDAEVRDDTDARF